jgi:hypothetical protein
MPINSIPLSETHIAGRARRNDDLEVTNSPGSEASAISPRHSRVKSSTKTKMRKRGPSAKASDRKSSPQHWFGGAGSPAASWCRAPYCARRVGAPAALLSMEVSRLLEVHERASNKQGAIAEPAADRFMLHPFQAGRTSGLRPKASPISER